MKHFGDITKLHGGDLPPVDVICGGSPCQDLSVAGKRAGMKNAINGDEETTRSGLFYDQIRIIKEMRNSYESGTDEFVRPGRYSIWENVPGAFSSNGGKDFQAVLTEFIRIVEPDAPDVPLPDKGKWPKAGCLYDEMGRWSLAWRLHDLQYWGCPQRRKRVCVLCDFDGPTAPWILFDPQFRREAETAPTEQAESDPGDEPRPEVQPVGEGLCGDSEPCGASGEGTAAGAEDGAGVASYTLKVRGGVEVDSNGRKAGKGALIQTELSGTPGVSQDQTLIQPCLNPWDVQSKHIQSEDGIAEALYSGECRYGGGESYVMAVDMYNQSVDGDVSKTLNSRATDSDHTPCVVAVDVYNQTEDGEIAASLTAASGGSNTSGPKVMSAGFKPRQSAQARDIGYEDEKSPTVLTDVNAAVLCLNDQGGQVMGVSEDVTGALRASMKHHEPIVYKGDSITSPINAANPQEGDPSHTLTADDRNYLVYENHPTDSRVTVSADGKVQTLTSRMGTGGNNVPLVLESNQNHATVTDNGVVNTLPSSMGMGGGYVPMVVDEPIGFTNRGFDSGDVAETLRSDPHGAYPMVADAYGFDPSAARYAGVAFEEKAKTLTSTTAPGFHDAVAYSIDKATTTGGNCTAGGDCAHEEYTPPLTTDRPHAVAYGIDQQGGKGGANYAEDVCPAVLSDSHGTPHAVAYGIDHVITTGGNCTAQGSCVYEDVEATLKAAGPHAVAYGISSFDSNAMKSDNPHSGIYEAESSRTLDLNGGSPACNQGGVAIVEPIPLEGNGQRESHRGDGYGGSGDPMFTLNSTEHHAVAESYQDTTGALMASGYSKLGTQEAANDIHVVGRNWDGTQVSPTLTSNNAGGNQRMPDKDNFNAVLAEPAGVECLQNGFYQATGDQAPSLLSRDYKDPPVVKKPQSVVRRLTPTECERLQGFPDGWTDIGEWTDSKGKTHKDADSPRYKALGNSIGLPFWQWLAERICSQYPPDHQVTLGSLFDGIGGFPLVFERCGGKAVWASEIEEFPIAVTKKHFPEEE